jgi:hypothetical protein
VLVQNIGKEVLVALKPIISKSQHVPGVMPPSRKVRAIRPALVPHEPPKPSHEPPHAPPKTPPRGRRT